MARVAVITRGGAKTLWNAKRQYVSWAIDVANFFVLLCASRLCGENFDRTTIFNQLFQLMHSQFIDETQILIMNRCIPSPGTAGNKS